VNIKNIDMVIYIQNKLIHLVMDSLKYFLLIIFFHSYGQDINVRYDSLVEKLKQTNNIDNKIELYFNLSQEIEHTDIKKSKYYSSFILDLSKKAQSKKGIGLYYNSQASINFKEKKLLKALAFSNKAERIFINSFDTLFYLKNLRTKVRILGNLDKKKEEYKSLIKGYNIAIQTKNFNEIADISFLLANDFTYLNVKQSFEYLNLAIQNFNLAKDDIGVAGCYYLMSKIYHDTGQFNKQIEYLDKCKALVDKIKDRKIFLLYCYREYTNAYLKQKKFRKAIQSALLATEINKKYGFSYDIYYEYINIAKIYIEQQNYNLAIRYLNKAFDIRPIDVAASFLIFKNLGTVNYKIRNYTVAKKNQINAIQLLDSSNIHLNREIFIDYANTLFALKEYSASFLNLKKYSDLNSDFLNKEKNSRLNLLQIQFDIDEKEAELNKFKLLKIQKDKQLILVNKLNYYLFLAILLVGSIFIIIFVFYILNRRKNRLLVKKNRIINDKVLELQESNLKVNNLLVVKESLIREIHHRVKNNLQLIMSLLNIQAQDAQTITTKDFLDKARSRIAAMSLIHQNLYQIENITFINFQEFLENLTQNIKETFGNELIEFEIITNDNNFDLDTSIPLSLIINELITNTFKHAFNNNIKGRINIKITKLDFNIYLLEIGDNGKGYTNKKKNTKSIGLELVLLLVKQLRGKIEKTDKDGTNYRIEFKQVNDL
jgi:two-component sensor histidine kinase